MANQSQVAELQAIDALYQEDEEVTLLLPDCASAAPQSRGSDHDGQQVRLEAWMSLKSGEQNRVIDLQVRIWLPSGYLSEEASEHCPPCFELASGCLSKDALRLLREELERLSLEDADSPIVLTWLEWLRSEAVTLLDAQGLLEHEVRQARPCSRPEACANCAASIAKDATFCMCRGECPHALCSKCGSMAAQVYEAAGLTPQCPLPQCQGELPEGVSSTCELWSEVSNRIFGTPFKDKIVFCPKCEDRGMDHPILMQDRCACFNCWWLFCGICRSPWHPGESCFEDESRVMRMTKRRPRLSQELAEKAAMSMDNIAASTRKKAEELADMLKERSDDFAWMRQSFLAIHQSSIEWGLGAVFGPDFDRRTVPLGSNVITQFMNSIQEMPLAEIRPAFHGTNIANYDSIYQRGLLVPGQGNELTILHGAVHGSGVYTANVDAAWLSKG
mmetsp:Transcript_66907/g.189125  ORF Transcript_66907/g.189125 Transcript_66907/m.189125 type:complete len:446 (+) Transcript_66907:64-1401(+)